MALALTPTGMSIESPSQRAEANYELSLECGNASLICPNIATLRMVTLILLCGGSASKTQQYYAAPRAVRQRQRYDERMKSTLDPDTTPLQKFKQFESGLRKVLSVSKTELLEREKQY